MKFNKQKVMKVLPFVVRLDIQHFCSSSLSTNILGSGIRIHVIIEKHKAICYFNFKFFYGLNVM